MADATLLPMVYDFCGTPMYHGERGEECDPTHPQACFCGAPFYLHCDGYLFGPNPIRDAVLSRSDIRPSDG